MIYKGTYQLCTVLLLIGMGLMHWKSHNKEQNQQKIKEEIIQSLEHRNELLAESILKKQKHLRTFRNRRYLGELYYSAKRMDSLVQSSTQLIDKEMLHLNNKESLNDSKQDFINQYKNSVVKLRNLIDSVKSHNYFRHSRIHFEQQRDELNEAIKDAAIAFQDKNNLKRKINLLKLKNSLLDPADRIGSTLAYCCSGGVTFDGSHICSSTETTAYRVGEQFKTNIILSERYLPASKILEVSVNGKSLPIIDNWMVKFEESITRNGNVFYKVKMVLEHAITQKKSTVSKTFFYTVY